MNIQTSTFLQKWNVMISPETEQNHRTNALYNHVATIATAVAFIALSVLSAIIFPEIATILIIGTAFLLTPGVEIARIFLSKARESKKLEEQNIKVRTIYERLVSKKVMYPEAKALCCYWKHKALEAEKGYHTLYQKALEKENSPNVFPSTIKKYRLEALQAEKEATTIKVYALFLESLIGKQKNFENVFLKHGENLSSAFSDFATWDSRETETRAMDPKFTKSDFLLTFHNKNITPISYEEVYQEKFKVHLKERLYQALAGAQSA